VNSKTNPVAVDHSFTFNAENNTFLTDGGIIQHMTLGISTIKKTHAPSEYKYWDMTSYASPALDPEKAYYLYAKCGKTTGNGSFLLSETAIGMEAVADYYHLLVGILNSEQDGDRSFAPLYGYSEILPGRITTDKIVSSDGKTYFDLINGIIGGRIKFLSTSETEVELNQWAGDTEESISQVQWATDIANNKLADIANDNKLTPADKQDTKKEWDVIVAEKLTIESQATTYGITTEKTNYVNSYNTLNTYITPLLSSLTTTSDIVGTTFRSNFKDYYDKKAILLKKITDSAKTLADNAQTAANNAATAAQNAQNSIDNLSVGGKNWIRNGNFGAGLQSWALTTGVTATILNITDNLPVGATTGIKLSCSAGQGIFQDFVNTKLELGKPHVLSFVAKADTSVTLDFGHEQSGNTRQQQLTTAWTKYLLKFTPTENKNIHFYILSSATFYITNIQLEQGSVPSDYRNYTYLEDALKGSTDVEGGLVLGNVIGTKNQLGQVKSYMSGLTDNPTAFAAGVQNFGSESETKNIDLRHDGSGQLANSNFWWDVLGNIFFGKDFDDKKITISPTATIPSLAEINNKEKHTADDFSSEENVNLNDPSQAPFVRSEENDVEFEIKSTFKFTTMYITIYIVGTQDASFSTKEAVISFQKKNLNGTWDIIEELTEEDFNESGYIELDLSGNNYEPGIYRFYESYTWSAYAIGANAYVYSEINSSIEYQLLIKRLTIASDGIAFSDSNSDNFFRLSLQDTIPFRYQGATDIPGVLLAGEVGYTGGFTSVWGAKKQESKSAEKTATGKYKVWHAVGHSKYQVQITPTTANRTCYIASRQTDYFEVYFYSVGSSPVLSDSGFHFSITGRNY
jgi:hypothetical protein